MGVKKYIYVALLAAAMVLAFISPVTMVNKIFAASACIGGMYIILTGKDKKSQEEEK